MFGSMRSLTYHYAPFQTQVPSHGHWCDLKVDHHNSALQSAKENVTIERTSPSVLAENWTSYSNKDAASLHTALVDSEKQSPPKTGQVRSHDDVPLQKKYCVSRTEQNIYWNFMYPHEGSKWNMHRKSCNSSFSSRVTHHHCEMCIILWQAVLICCVLVVWESCLQ